LTAQSADERFKELYDVERHVMATDGGILVEDPYPDFHRLLAEAPVHEGTIRELIGYGPNMYREHLFKGVPFFSAFSFEANDIVLRDNDTFSSKFYEGFTTAMFGHTILEMVGEEHRRYRAPLLLAAQDRTTDQSGEVGALVSQRRQPVEVVADFVQHFLIASQPEQRVRVAAG